MIKIVFTASPHLLSRIIRWFTRGRTSHVAIEYPSTLWGGRWIADAHAVGVRKVPASRLGCRAAEFECSFDAAAHLPSIRKYFGERYDVGGLFVIAWSIFLWRVFRKKLKKPMNNTSGQFCSELVARVFAAAELPGTKAWDPELQTPDDLLEYCESLPELFGRTA